MIKILVLVNKAKLYGKYVSLFNNVIDELTKLGHTSDIQEFSSIPECASICEKYLNDQDISRLVVCGGDGTLNIVLQNWKRTDVPIALIPLGTCNLFAMECGYSKNASQIATIIHQGNTRQFYCGKANDNVFASVAGCGLDSNIMWKVNYGWLKYLGRVYLFLRFFKHLFKKNPQVRFMTDGSKIIEATSLLIAKGKYYAGKFSFAPQASIFDPSLYALFYKSSSIWNELKLALILFTNKDLTKENVFLIQFNQLEILNDGYPVQLDGDVNIFSPAKFQIDKNPRLVCVPEKKF